MCTYLGMCHLHCVRSCIDYWGRELDILKDVDFNYCDRDPVEHSLSHDKHKHNLKREEAHTPPLPDHETSILGQASKQVTNKQEGYLSTKHSLPKPSSLLSFPCLPSPHSAPARTHATPKKTSSSPPSPHPPDASACTPNTPHKPPRARQ